MELVDERGFRASSRIANQSLLGLALFLPHGAEISVAGFVHNQIYVTAGNIVGGGLMVGLVYWFAGADCGSHTADAKLNDLKPVKDAEG